MMLGPFFKFAVVSAVCGFIAAAPASLAKAEGAGNPEHGSNFVSPEIENLAKSQFKLFYSYGEARGMVPMRFLDPEGKATTLENYRGKLVLLNFWATWCAPCARELPHLADLQEKIPQDRFIILPASADFGIPPSKIRDFMKKHKAEALNMLMLEESDAVWEIVSTGLPISFLIGPDGQVLYKMVGEADWSGPEMSAFIVGLLKNQALFQPGAEEN